MMRSHGCKWLPSPKVKRMEVNRANNKNVKVAVLVSGGGTNLQALIDAESRGELSPATIALVISNREKAGAMERAGKAGIACKLCYKDSEERDILRWLNQYGIELVVLAGYLKILSADFLKSLERPVINIHPALLPAYGGKGYYGLRVHEKVLENKERITGATVHYVTEIPDGGQIILQREVPVCRDDTPEILQQRVMEEAEWKILPEAVRQICSEIVKHKHEMATDDERVNLVEREDV